MLAHAHPSRPKLELLRAEPMIEIDHVSKTFGKGASAFTALGEIDLSLAQGEFVSILGPSGCGKSTLARCIAGLEAPSAGSIRLHGVEVKEPPDGAAFIFQRDVLLDWRTVLDNVLLPVEYKRLKRADWIEPARKLLESFGLQGVEDRHPWQLSGGMRQRVSICRGMLMQPSLLIMDEPFGALDAITRDELNLELQRAWHGADKTILFITHSIAEAVFLSTRVVVMAKNPGRIAADISIDIPFPRSFSVRETPQFTRYVAQLRAVFESLGIMKAH